MRLDKVSVKWQDVYGRQVLIQHLDLVDANYYRLGTGVQEVEQYSANGLAIQDLRLRWEEANQIFQAGAYLSTIIMLGSLLEGVLLAKVEPESYRSQRVNKCP